METLRLPDNPDVLQNMPFSDMQLGEQPAHPQAQEETGELIDQPKLAEYISEPTCNELEQLLEDFRTEYRNNDRQGFEWEAFFRKMEEAGDKCRSLESATGDSNASVNKLAGNVIHSFARMGAVLQCQRSLCLNRMAAKGEEFSAEDQAFLENHKPVESTYKELARWQKCTMRALQWLKMVDGGDRLVELFYDTLTETGSAYIGVGEAKKTLSGVVGPIVLSQIAHEAGFDLFFSSPSLDTQHKIDFFLRKQDREEGIAETVYAVQAKTHVYGDFEVEVDDPHKFLRDERHRRYTAKFLYSVSTLNREWYYQYGIRVLPVLASMDGVVPDRKLSCLSDVIHNQEYRKQLAAKFTKDLEWAGRNLAR